MKNDSTEMRGLADKANDIDKHVTDAIEKIKEAALQGKYSIRLPFEENIMHSVARDLRSRGYQLEVTPRSINVQW